MNFDWFHLAVWWTSVCYKSSPEICRASTSIHPYRSALPFLLLSICLNPHENICEASLQNTAPERREGAAEESRGKKVGGGEREGQEESARRGTESVNGRPRRRPELVQLF